MKPLNWGVLGASRIFEKVHAELKDSPQNKFLAIASRSLEKSKSLAKKLEIPNAYGSYEELLNNSLVDAIYIALPNSLHAEWIEKALLKNKAVLCEKPIALSLEEFDRIAKISEEKKILLMEGMMYRLHPQILKLEDEVRSGQFGKITHLKGHFQISERPLTDIRMSSDLGGGALWDLGCYLANLCAIVSLGKLKSAEAHCKKQNNVPIEVYAQVVFEDGTKAVWSCGFTGARSEQFEVIGSKRNLVLDKPFKPDNATLYKNEFEHFYKVYYGVEKNKLPLQESRRTLEILCALNI